MMHVYWLSEKDTKDTLSNLTGMVLKIKIKTIPGICPKLWKGTEHPKIFKIPTLQTDWVIRKIEHK